MIIIKKIIAHRGNGFSKYNSNTKEAIMASLNNAYCAGVELDIRLTKDKKIVIVHDPIIDLVSNGSGLVSNLTLKQLQKYNFGSKEFPSKIATLEDVLKTIKTKKIILIEIKAEFDNYELVDYLIPIIKKYQHLNIRTSSFNYDIIKYLKQNSPFKCSILVGMGFNAKKNYNSFDFNIVEYSYKDKIDINKETFIWNMHTKKEVSQDFYIITDHPKLFI